MDRVSDSVDSITKILLIAVLVVMAVVVFTQVIFRYAINLPLFWTEEFARYCLVWASLLGAGVAFKRGEHIAVTLFTDRFLPGRKSVVTDFMVDIFVAIILVVIFWGGISLVLMTRSQISPALRIPMAIPYLAIPIGSAIMMIHQIASSYQKLRLSGIIKAKLKLKVVTITPEGHAYNAGATEFARLINERTGGAIEVVLKPGGISDGGEEAIVKGLQMGTIDLAIISTGPLGTFSPDIGIIDLPYLFRDHEHVDKVFEGVIGQQLLDSLDMVKGLSFMENGFRHLTSSSRPLLEPKDCVGLKIRTMDNLVHMASIRTLGADPVPMKWGGKVLDALKTGAIDGQENPVSIISANKLNEFQKYLSLTGHFYSSAPLCMNKKKFDTLKPAWQKTFLECAGEAAVFERKLAREAEQNQIEALKAEGMEICTADLDAFTQAMESAKSFYLSKYPAWEETANKISAT